MSQTPYLGILLTSADDTNLHFSDWRQRIDGKNDSNMLKIDAAFGEHTTSNANDESGAHGIRVKDNAIQILGDDGEWSDAVADPGKDYALAEHTHDEYSLSDHIHEEYAPVSHGHGEYALTDHSHDKYALEGHSHGEYAESEHKHSEYAPNDHGHSEYAKSGHNHDNSYAAKEHSHAEYSKTGHTHSASDVGADVSGAAAAVQAILDAHKSAANPHGITPEMIGALAAQTGSAGQVLGFTSNNVVGAMDLDVGGDCSVVFGTYVGNGVSAPSLRTITLGFRPRFVWVGSITPYQYDPASPWDNWRYVNPNGIFMIASHLYSDYVFDGQERKHPYGSYSTDPSYLNTYDRATIATTLKIVDTGFSVANSEFYAEYSTTMLGAFNDINKSGTTYFYLAIK